MIYKIVVVVFLFPEEYNMIHSIHTTFQQFHKCIPLAVAREAEWLIELTTAILIMIQLYGSRVHAYQISQYIIWQIISITIEDITQRCRLPPVYGVVCLDDEVEYIVQEPRTTLFCGQSLASKVVPKRLYYVWPTRTVRPYLTDDNLHFLNSSPTSAAYMRQLTRSILV